MKDILYRLYDGELSRTNLEFTRGTPYAEAFDRAVEAENALLTTLNDEQKQLLHSYFKANETLHGVARREDFAAGFRLGVQLMLAALDDDHASVRPAGTE